MTLPLLLSILLMQGAALPKGGVVAGRLRATDGAPTARVRVGVMAVPEAGRQVKGAGTLVGQVETDDAGRFQLEEVPPGRYYIVAGLLNDPTFYPGVRDIAAARTIQVLANATVRDIDFEVVASSTPAAAGSPLPVVIIAGRIVLKNNPNAPMPPVITLEVSPTTATSVIIPGSFTTVAVAQNGTFNATFYDRGHRLSDVRLPEGYSVASITSAGKNFPAEPIDVKAGVDLVVSVDVGDLRPRYRLMALVREDSTERPLAGERVELVLSSGEVLLLTVNPQGVVTFPRLLPGPYVLRLASDGFDVPEKQVVITDGSVQVELRARKKP